MSGAATIYLKDQPETENIEAKVQEASPYIFEVQREEGRLRVQYYGMMHRYDDGRHDTNDEAVETELEKAGFEVMQEK